MTQVVIVYHSRFGHTKRQAEAVARGAERVAGVDVRLLTAAQAIEQIDSLDAADAILFGCPTFMGNISAGMKEFIEAASGKWFAQAWKDKIAGAFTTSSSFSGDKLNTLLGLVVNAMQHGMIYVGMAMLPSENEPDSMLAIQGPGPNAHNRVGAFIGPMGASLQMEPSDTPARGDIETAEIYGQRVAEITRRFKRAAAE